MLTSPLEGAAPCGGCGAPVAADFAFCPRCGRRLGGAAPAPAAAESAPDGDRRTVTVLFADLCGFTGLAERTDPEDVRAFQGELFAELSGAAQRYEGFVEKYVGDAVMTIFGAPRAHEDDPERALHAALLMQRRIAALDGRWARRLGQPVALRVGVATGPVVAGTLGSAAGAAYAVTGDTVNTAARLQAACAPGQVLVAAATQGLARHAFAFEAVGEIALRGRAEPVQAYRVLAPLAEPASTRGLASIGLAAPFVGRDAELARLRVAFEQGVAGRAQLVSVVGEAGIGKSRLLAEFVERLRAAGELDGVTVRRAACSGLGEQTYGLLAALLRDAYGVTTHDSLEAARAKLAAGLEALGADDDERARFAGLLAHVLGLEPADAATRHLQPEQLQRQVFLAARALVERRLRNGPLLLVLEDLHGADRASVELLRFILEQLADRPLVLLAAHRPALEGSGLGGSRVRHELVRLGPLTADESRRWLEAVLGAAPSRPPSGVPDLILDRAGGNPLYLEEMVRSLVAPGAPAGAAPAWRWTGEDAPDVPPSLRGLLLARLDRLPPGARRVAQEAAVLGPEFDADWLRAASAEATGLDAALAELTGTEVLQPVAGDGAPRWRFVHTLLQEVVYDSLLRRRREDLHTQAARALEALRGPSPGRLEDLEALGHHWCLSADRRRGARYLVSAGDWARAVHANADAVRCYERARATLEACGDCEDERLEIGERLADVLALTGRREEAVALYEAARQGHAAGGRRRDQARLHRKLGVIHWERGEAPRALGCFEAGLALLAGGEAPVERAQLYQEMGRLAFRGGDHARATDWAARALALAEPLLGDPGPPLDAETRREAAAAVAHAHNTLGAVLARSNRLEEAVARVERSVAVSEREGLLQVACRGYANLGVLYSTLHPARAIETCQRGLEVARRIGDLAFQSRLYANLAVAYCALTNQCDAQGIGAAQAAIELDRRLGLLDHLAVPLIVLAQIYQCHGQPGRARAHYEEALGLAEEAGDPQLLFPCYDGLATLALEAGDEQRAEEYLARARAVCERLGVEPDALVVLPFLG